MPLKLHTRLYTYTSLPVHLPHIHCHVYTGLAYRSEKPDLQITGHIRREILKGFRTSDVLSDFV